MGLYRLAPSCTRTALFGSFGLVLFYGCYEPSRPASDAEAAMDAGAPAFDGGVRDELDGGGLDAAVDPLVALRIQTAALRELLAGRLPTDLDPQSLFEADLLDESSRLARIETLERRVGADRTVAHPGDAPPTQVDLADAGPSEAGVLDAAPDERASQGGDGGGRDGVRRRAAGSR